MSDPEPLTPEELAALVRLMTDPEARRRTWDAVQQTYLNPEFWRRGAEAIQRTYLNPELWRAVGEGLQRTYLNPAFWEQAASVVRETYSAENLRRLAEAVARDLDADALSVYLDARLADPAAAAAREFEREMAAVPNDRPEPEQSPALGWWLATTPLHQQLGLLAAGLAVINAYLAFADSMTEPDIPDPVLRAMAAVIGTVSFIAVWLGHRDREPPD